MHVTNITSRPWKNDDEVEEEAAFADGLSACAAMVSRLDPCGVMFVSMSALLTGVGDTRVILSVLTANMATS